MVLFLTLLQCSEVPITHPNETAALGEFNWQLPSYKFIVCINSCAINRQKGKSILSFKRAAALLKRSLCVFATSLSLHPTERDPGGRVISKIQHHLVLHCCRSPTRCPHLDTLSTGSSPLFPSPAWDSLPFWSGHFGSCLRWQWLSEGCFNNSLCASVYSQRSSSLLHNSWRNSVKTSSKPQIICEMQLETIFVDSSHCKHPFPLFHHTFYSCVLKPGKISSCAEILRLSDTNTAVFLGSGCIPVLCRTREGDVLFLRVQRGKILSAS